MAVKRVIEEKCVGCKTCVKSCPADVFRYDGEKKKAYVKYGQDCQLCLWCITECPAGAIELTKDKEFPVFTCWG